MVCGTTGEDQSAGYTRRDVHEGHVVFRTRSYREAMNRRTRMRSAFCLEPFLNSPPRGDEINEKQR
jgi:hypothetical protein